jgi:hypothetical protein
MNQLASAIIRLGAGEILVGAVVIRNPQDKSGFQLYKFGKSQIKAGSWHGKSGLALRPAENHSRKADSSSGKLDFPSGLSGNSRKQAKNRKFPAGRGKEKAGWGGTRKTHPNRLPAHAGGKVKASSSVLAEEGLEFQR